MAEIIKDKPFYDKSNGGVTLSGGEPLLQADFATALCDALHAKRISVGIETAANVSRDVFLNVVKKCDFAYIDLKHWDSEMYRQGTGADNSRILANIREALKLDIPVTLRIPMIPGFNDSEEDARKFGALLKELGATNVHVLPFHQLGENKYKKYGISYAYSGVLQLHEEDAAGSADILSSTGLSVQIGG
jgi:pyruvate formate lyase activating enzyme